MKNKISVAITGYYGTGSSALIDLLKEYDSVKIAAPTEKEYEHIAFYAPGGLFDLFSIISSGYCSVYNSDMAINNFINISKKLNKDFGWFGAYCKYGSKYLDITKKFVNEIGHKTGRQSTAHIVKTRFSIFKVFIQIVARIIIKRPINKLGRIYVYDKNPGYYSMPDKDSFVRATKIYVESFLNMCSTDADIDVFDHLLWPQQISLVNQLFPQNFRVIVVDRDPRDVFLLNKYYWFKPMVSMSSPHYQLDVNKFCDEWLETRKNSQSDLNDKILHIKFEDLIYNYDFTKNKIESFLGVNVSKHCNKNKFFDPSLSIENTQIFMENEGWKQECEIIEKRLPEYLYSFKYNRRPNKSLWFDTNAQLTSVKKRKNK